MEAEYSRVKKHKSVGTSHLVVLDAYEACSGWIKEQRCENPINYRNI